MLKKIALLLIIFASAFSGFAQPEWRQIPANPNIESSNSYDIAVGENGLYYAIYTKYNNSTLVFDIYFDYYTYQSGWNNMLIAPTTNGFDITVKTIRSGTNIYAMANTSAGDELTVFQISGNTAYQLLVNNFTNFDPYSNWRFKPGVSASEFYLTYVAGGNTYLYEFDYNTVAWYPRGNPFAPQGILPSDFDLYVNQDSVFVAGRYYAGGTDKIKLTVAQKGIWTWNDYGVAYSDVYAENAGVADTVTGYSQFSIFGDGNDFKRFIGYDQSLSEEIEITLANGTYGASATVPLDYDNNTLFTFSDSHAYIMTTASNLSDNNVVYKRPLNETGTWSLLTSSGFALPSVTTSNKKIKTHNTTERIAIAYQDFTPNPAEHVFLLTNTPPVITDNGSASSDLCSDMLTAALTSMLVHDAEMDSVTFVGVTSTNASVIDPAGVSVYIYNNGNGNFEIYADATVSSLSATENVSLVFTFTDGFDQIQHQVDYVVNPSPVVTWTDDTLTFCSNGAIVDLYDFVSQPGGEFGVNESSYPGHYFDPTTVADPLTFSMDLYYYYSNGTCSSSTTVTIEAWEAPSAAITTTPTTNCTANDGTATLTITGGTTPYTFVWNVGNYIDPDLYQLAAGSLHADVVDANGCITVADAVLENSGAPVTGVVTPIDCYGNNNGAIDLTVTGLVPPLTVLWSNGYSTEDISNLQPGTHEVWITDASGCSVSQSFVVTQPDKLDLELYASGTTCGLQEGSANINWLQGGSQPYSYLWEDGSTTDNLINLAAGIYSLTVTDDNGCTVSDSVVVSSYNSPYTTGYDITDVYCNNTDGAIHITVWSQDTTTQYEWSNGATTEDLTQLSAGSYTLHLFNDSGCDNYEFYTVETIAPDRQPICVVTVDSTTSTNLVVWEKTGDWLIDHYNIYRETTIAGQYMLIDTVSNNNLSVFNDVVASPIERSWQYRITAVNECGVESIPSEAHKTIHLTTEDLGNGDFKIIWNSYQGTVFTSYNLYRYTTVAGWELVSVVPATDNSFIDTPLNTSGLDYMVDFDLENGCTADVIRAQDFNSARSNKDKGQFSAGDGTGNSNNGLIETGFDNGTVQLYPNPVTGDNIFIKLTDIKTVNFELISITGQLIDSGVMSEGITSLNTQQLHPGLYILNLHNENERTGIRFIVE